LLVVGECCWGKMFGEKDDGSQIIPWTLRVTGSLSLLGSVFILITFLLIHDWRFPNNLIFFLTLSDFLWVATFFWGDAPRDTAACAFQGVFGGFWGLATTYWILFIAVIYNSQLNPSWKRFFHQYEQTIAHAVVWPLSFFLTLLPYFLGDYTPNPKNINIPVCWIARKDDGARFWAYYGWVILDLIAIPILYGHLVYTLRTAPKRPTLTYRWLAYPIAFWICWFEPTVFRILEQVNPNRDYTYLVVIQSITMLSQGMLNALIYGFRASIFKQIKNRWTNKSVVDEESQLLKSISVGT